MTIVVVSPHRDDAAFSLGLSIGAWLRAGHAVVVLNCFVRSDYAPYSDVENVHANDRISYVSAVRLREDQAWAKRYRAQRLQLRDLDLMDAPLRLACAVEEVLTAEIRPGDRAVERVRGAIAKLLRRGDTALAAPLSAGGHIDHRVVREAAVLALAEVPAPACFYEDLPYAAAGGALTAERVAELAAELPFPLQQQVISAEVPTDRFVEEKRRMADCYDSQVDRGVVEQMAQTAGHLQGERVWANAAWLAEAALAGNASPND